MAKIFEFNGNKGSLLDQVSKTAGTLTAGTSRGFVKTEKGLAMKFDGAVTKIDYGDRANITTNDFAMEAWVKLTNYDNFNIMFGKSDATDGYILLSNPTDGLPRIRVGGTPWNIGSTPIPLNKWNHVFCNFDRDGNAEVFLNNISVGTQDISSESSSITNASSLLVGTLTTHFLTGNQAKCRLYDSLLTQNERNTLYEEFQNSHGVSEQKRGFNLIKPTDLSSEVDSVVGSDELAPLDFTSVWTSISASNITSDSFETAGAGGLGYQLSNPTGKRYKVNIVGTTSSSELTVREYTSTIHKNLGTGAFDETFTFDSDAAAATPGRLYLRHDGAGVTTISKLTITELTGLVAAYNFQPSSGGVLTDISGEGNNGTITGALSTKDGMAFDGVTSTITSALTQTAVSPFSVCLRFKTSSDVTTEQTLWSDYLGTSDRSIIQIQSGTFRTVIYNGTEYKISGTVVGDTWYNVVLTWDGSSTIKLYLDAIPQSGTTSVNHYASGGALILGGLSTTTYIFNGIIGDYKAYNYAFTPTQAQAYHNSFIKPTIRESFSDSGADGIVKLPKGWM